MAAGLDIAFFGSSLVSAYWNGAATYYRGIVRALHARGHRVTFYEPDAFDRQKHRDIPDPDWAAVVVYPGEGTDGVRRCLDRAAAADVIVKASGVGVFDELLEAAVPTLGGPRSLRIFWDVDAPATLARMRDDPADPFRELVRGTTPCSPTAAARRWSTPIRRSGRGGASRSITPSTRRRTTPSRRTAIRVGPHVPRQPAAGPGGAGAGVLPRTGPPVRLGPVPAGRQRVGRARRPAAERPNPGARLHHDHNALNRTALAVLNVSRDSMAAVGYSPATRVFEAAGASACLITDAWEGIELFLEPGREVLVASDAQGVEEALRGISPRMSREFGEAALKRVLAQHTYDRRAVRVEELLTGETRKGV